MIELTASDVATCAAMLREYSRAVPIYIDFYIKREMLWLELKDLYDQKEFLRHLVESRLASGQPRLTLKTRVDLLGEPRLFHKVPPPSGFIFHMSRCGSTLLARLLARLERHLVVEESTWINDMLKLCDYQILKGAEETWFRNLVLSHGPRGQGGERRYYLKLSSWNAAFIDFIQRVFPDVPTIFLFRDPHEVLVSVLQSPPGFLREKEVFGPGFFRGELDAEACAGLDEVRYCARLLAFNCRHVLEAVKGPQLFLEYRDLTRERLPPLMKFFGENPSPAELEAAAAQFDVYSKDPGGRRKHRSDVEKKRCRVTGAMKALIRDEFGDLYQRLQARAGEDAGA